MTFKTASTSPTVNNAGEPPASTMPWVDREAFGHPVSGSLATIIRQYKSSVTRLVVQQFGGAPRVWQRSYYEHVIRDDDDRNRITRYIDANPANWALDDEYS